MVEDREKELTQQHIRDILHRCLNDIKSLTPVLISGIKMYISVYNNSNSTANSINDARQCRDDTSRQVCSYIDEIIRALQITDVDHDDGSGAKNNNQVIIIIF